MSVVPFLWSSCGQCSPLPLAGYLTKTRCMMGAIEMDKDEEDVEMSKSEKRSEVLMQRIRLMAD